MDEGHLSKDEVKNGNFEEKAAQSLRNQIHDQLFLIELKIKIEVGCFRLVQDGKVVSFVDARSNS